MWFLPSSIGLCMSANEQKWKYLPHSGSVMQDNIAVKGKCFASGQSICCFIRPDQNQAAIVMLQESSSRKTCRDYSNGGPAFVCSEDDADSVKELAWYEGKLGTAAVRCKVSQQAFHLQSIQAYTFRIRSLRV